MGVIFSRDFSWKQLTKKFFSFIKDAKDVRLLLFWSLQCLLFKDINNDDDGEKLRRCVIKCNRTSMCCYLFMSCFQVLFRVLRERWKRSAASIFAPREKSNCYLNQRNNLADFKTAPSSCYPD